MSFSTPRIVKHGFGYTGTLTIVAKIRTHILGKVLFTALVEKFQLLGYLNFAQSYPNWIIMSSLAQVRIKN